MKRSALLVGADRLNREAEAAVAVAREHGAGIDDPVVVRDLIHACPSGTRVVTARAARALARYGWGVAGARTARASAGTYGAAA